MVSFRLSLAAILVASALAAAPAATPFEPGQLDFAVRVDGEETAYRVLGVYVMPEETLEIEVVRPKPGEGFKLATDVTATTVAQAHWKAKAPILPGFYPVSVVRDSDQATMVLNVFVMRPLAEAVTGKLRGYKIGNYPPKALAGRPVYEPPKGLVEVTREMLDTPVSPHFELRQFLCKQQSGFPKFVAMNEKLVIKLETLLAAVNEAGFRGDTFGFISAYRTPFYNAQIDNVLYSRHLWGDAADIFVDGNRDGRMDDLDKDGRVDADDSLFLYHFIEEMSDKSWYKRFEGGLGRYRPTSAHAGFVHVDTRGFPARWGT